MGLEKLKQFFTDRKGDLPPELRRQFPKVHVGDLHTRLNFQEKFGEKSYFSEGPLHERPDNYDHLLFRYLYRNFKPKRHLEIGTWQGEGALDCLQECKATVWTLNLPFGEKAESGERAYGFYNEELEDIQAWAKKIYVKDLNRVPTDSIGFIGRRYLARDLGHRVCQIYCDSTRWDTSAYPAGFFDSSLIDGCHFVNIVRSDTDKVLPLVRPGGLVLWHDVCPDLEVMKRFRSTRDLVDFFQQDWDAVAPQMRDLFWIEPSWILCGIRK